MSIVTLIIISLFCININDVIKVKGIVRSKNNPSEIKNIIPGTITSVNYKPNQFVKQGDILFTINDDSYAATMNMLTDDYESTLKEIECTNAILEGIKTNINPCPDDDYIGTQVDNCLKTIKYFKRQIEINKLQYEYENYGYK